MKERPIIFSGEMVRTIMDGRKTQTRRECVFHRIIKKSMYLGGEVFNKEIKEIRDLRIVDGDINGAYWIEGDFVCVHKDYLQEFVINRCPYGQVGDRLWVRETWACVKTRRNDLSKDQDTVYFECDREFKYVNPWEKHQNDGKPIKWKPSIHMPRWASRRMLWYSQRKYF